jgi:hypothetical protein
MRRLIDARTEQQRRKDRWTAERVDLAVLTARAFDLYTARNYLRLSGMQDQLIASFSDRYPNGLRSVDAKLSHGRRRGEPPILQPPRQLPG